MWAAGLNVVAALLEMAQYQLGLVPILAYLKNANYAMMGGEVAGLMVDAGLLVIAAFISPFRADRDAIRSLLPGRFIEVYVDTPLAVCEQRDPKGLYRRARAGLIKEFTGLDSPFEPPLAAELRFDTTALAVDEAVQQIHDYLRSRYAC